MNNAYQSNNISCVLLFGAPGSGKGTIGKALSAIPGIYHCSSGDLIRDRVRQETSGSQIGRLVAAGHLLSDSDLWKEFDRYLHDLRSDDRWNANSILLLDGIPRTETQCESLIERMNVRGIFCLDCVEETVLVDRLRRRFEESERADDGAEESIRTRLHIYRQQTTAVLDYFPAELISKFDATLQPESVLLEVLYRLRNLRTEISCRSESRNICIPG